MSHLEVSPARKWLKTGRNGMPVPGPHVGVCAPACAGVEQSRLSAWLILDSTCIFLGAEGWMDTQPRRAGHIPALGPREQGKERVYCCRKHPSLGSPPTLVFLEQLPIALPLPCLVPQKTTLHVPSDVSK